MATHPLTGHQYDSAEVYDLERHRARCTALRNNDTDPSLTGPLTLRQYHDECMALMDSLAYDTICALTSGDDDRARGHAAAAVSFRDEAFRATELATNRRRG